MRQKNSVSIEELSVNRKLSIAIFMEDNVPVVLRKLSLNVVKKSHNLTFSAYQNADIFIQIAEVFRHAEIYFENVF